MVNMWFKGSSPVVLPKEPCIHLSIFVSKSFGRPKWESLQLGPDQRVGVALMHTYFMNRWVTHTGYYVKKELHFFLV